MKTRKIQFKTEDEAVRIMFKRLTLREFRGYSTISIQSTIPKTRIAQQQQQQQQQQQPSSPLPPQTVKPITPIEEVEEKQEDPIQNLQKARLLFKDQHHLYNKIDTLLKTLKNPEYPIRIGLLNTNKSLLNSLLSDPFATDQAWYHHITRRENKAGLIKYGDFNIVQNGVIVPSPFLKGVELYELDKLGDDGCHLYVNAGSSSTDDLANYREASWVQYDWIDSLSEELSNKEVNSSKAETALELLTNSPQNASKFITLYNESGFKPFLQFIEKVTNRDIVIKRLYGAVVDNLTKQLKNTTIEELDGKDIRIKSTIKNWDENIHHEFQREFKPFVENYERTELNWWKLYYKSDDIVEIVRVMLQNGLNGGIDKFNYVRGQIDSLQLVTPTNNELDDINELVKIKNQFINENAVTLQNQVTKLLFINFIGIQLPVIFMSSLGFFLYDFSAFSMVGLGLLGSLVGANNVSKKWLELISDFKQELFEKIRIGIVKMDESLIKEWETKYGEEKREILKRNDIIRDLEDDINRYN